METKKRDIAILMATYNGEAYLQQQIDSLLAQTYKDWTLYIHDDGSTDATIDIITQYTGRHDNIRLLDYTNSLHGAMYNFLSMLEHVRADYYMFCDQDDVWHPEKIACSIDEMQAEEKRHPGKACLVFTDLAITDSQLNVTSPSFWRYTKVYPELIHTFNDCGATLFVTGCTMLFNHAARTEILPPPPEATMHDAWITLCIAKSGGILHPIRQPLVYYRQHGDNTLGAADARPTPIIQKILNIRHIHQRRMQHYQMLRSVGYGSLPKHILHKIIYKLRVWHKRK